MAKHRMEDASIPVIDRKYQRFFTTGTVCFLIRIGRVQNIPDIARSPHTVVKFIFGMTPFQRQALHNRMHLVTPVQHIFVLASMRTPRTRRTVLDQFSVLPIHIRAGILITSFPTTQSTDLIELRPFGESIVGCMINDNTTAVLHIFQEAAVRLLRPRISVIVQHYQLVRAKVEHKTGHILALFGRDGKVHIKTTGIFQDLFQHNMAHLPVMVVLSCDQ